MGRRPCSLWNSGYGIKNVSNYQKSLLGAKPIIFFDFFSRILLNALSVQKNIYIGLQRSATAYREWTWAKGVRATPTAILWSQGEPSGGGETCAEMRIEAHHINQGWGTNDIHCSVSLIGLCEKRFNQN